MERNMNTRTLKKHLKYKIPQIKLVEQALRYSYQNFLFHDSSPCICAAFRHLLGQGGGSRVKREVTLENKRLGARA